MKTILAACAALGIVGGFVSTAHAADYYWRSHHDVEWQDRTGFREPEHVKPAWLREHCIRDWEGHELCRR